MARIESVDIELVPMEVQKIFKRQEEQYGTILNPARIYGRRPTILKGMTQHFEGITLSGLIHQQLKSLLFVRVAAINGCPF